MSYTSKDGHTFPSLSQQRLYEESEGNLHRNSLADIAKARGGPGQQDAINQHGIAKKVTITREGMGRHRVEAEMGDGSKYTSVHPEAYRANDIAKELLGIEPPPAFQVAGRARSQPTGPKENERLRREDGREEDEDGFER